MSFHVRRSNPLSNVLSRRTPLSLSKPSEGWRAALKRLLFPVETADYRVWRHQFMIDRLGLTFWIAIPCFLTLAGFNLYAIFSNPERFEQDITQLFQDSTLAERYGIALITSILITTSLLLGCVMLQRTRLRQHPEVIFLCFSLSLTLTDQIVGTVFQIPVFPDTFVLLAQAILIPVHWRLHLLSQLLPIAYSLIVNPMLGITQLGERSIYDSFSISNFANLFWVCLICNLAVYLYERLKRSEFESQRQLQVFLHSVSHDLRTPVMGTSMVLKGLLNSPDSTIAVHRSVLKRLLEGSDRQLTLINSLLEAHTSEMQTVSLNRQPMQLSLLVESVLAELDHALTRHEVQLCNQVSSELPLVYADTHQLWRVFSNLIGNALKHNPNGICLTLAADVVPLSWGQPNAGRQPGLGLTKDARNSSQPFLWLRCIIQDNGVGIPVEQHDRLFDLYARGSRARYMPGLGLGLYLCRQIVQAHGGQIGVISAPHQGATFWFTLPIVAGFEDTSFKN
ncbi:sensor histidine kinase [Thermocoleostomius sinensis]|uniref:histidine kinase n=1 Tax=Thermocoleostomius sinensis A174 TaxID=2016057 RepID=A0A9E8ZBI5_9CYAN|nr:ATP-binding protein [Thermocoleostomius sinensis]WAL58812.1 ATP-binding protein [Thermocoleostomius sinensis A174]